MHLSLGCMAPNKSYAEGSGERQEGSGDSR